MTVKEANDVVVLINATADAVKAAKADGAIDWRDAKEVIGLLPELRDAVKDANKIPEQVKGATNEELQQLATDSMTAAYRLVEAVLS